MRLCAIDPMINNKHDLKVRHCRYLIGRLGAF